MKKVLTRLLGGIEEKFDDLTFALKKRFDLDQPLQIVLYRTYGTKTSVYIKGRVLEDKFLKRSKREDSIFDNLLKMYKRFESDEVRDALLRMEIQGREYTVTSDEEGYFVLEAGLDKPISDEVLLLDVPVKLIDAPVKFSGEVKATATVMIPPTDAEFGVISDIDDTIIRTSATSLIAMSRNTFFHNAHTRLPFAGVSEFYKALQLGRNGKRNNPFFYVSSSPWNLYDLLIDFLDINDIPEGPLLLRDFGFNRSQAGSTDHMSHKFMQIKRILETYPTLPFILIGDSGQEDPKIYREVVQQFPGRILVIYIRDVQLASRERIAIDIKESLAGSNVEMIIVDNTAEAAAHASTMGLIYTESVAAVEVDKKLDKGELPGKEEMSVTSNEIK